MLQAPLLLFRALGQAALTSVHCFAFGFRRQSEVASGMSRFVAGKCHQDRVRSIFHQTDQQGWLPEPGVEEPAPRVKRRHDAA